MTFRFVKQQLTSCPFRFTLTRPSKGIRRCHQVYIVCTPCVCVMNHYLYLCHLLIAIYISSLHSGNRLEQLDIQSVALFCWLLFTVRLPGSRSRIQSRREMPHCGGHLSHHPRISPHLTQIFHPQFCLMPV